MDMKAVPWIAAGLILTGIIAYALWQDRLVTVPDPGPTESQATFAGGCFWCTEAAFEELPGVSSSVSGYANRREAVRINFDPALVSYSDLLNVFWRNIDPTDANGQFRDRGKLYSSAILYHTDEQRAAAEESKAALIQSGRFEGVVTALEPVDGFRTARAGHQDYARRCPARYKIYRKTSGRDSFQEHNWDDRQ